MAMGTLMTLSAQNAVAAQQQANSVAAAVTSACVKSLLGSDAK